MVCPKCGQVSRNGRTVCALCGTPLKEKRKIWPVLLALLLSLAILGGLAWWLWPRLTAPREEAAPEESPETAVPAAAAEPTPTPEPTPSPEELLWTQVRQVYACGSYAAAIRTDGTVALAGSLEGGVQADVSDWTDMRSLLLLPRAIFGLTEDGHVRMTGQVSGMEPAAGWENIDRLFYSAEALYGLSPEGQLFGAGPRLYFDASVYRDVETVLPTYADTLLLLRDGDVQVIPMLGMFSGEGSLRNIVQVAINSDFALFRLADGSVQSSASYRYNCEYNGWPNPYADWAGLTDLGLGLACAVGLTEDGHVLSAPCLPWEAAPDTSAWENVKEILFLGDRSMVYGLTDDGRVLCACAWIQGPFPWESWQGVTALQANAVYTAGLTGDGRVLTSSIEPDAAALDTEGWRGVGAIALGEDFLLGLRTDGGVYLAGSLD